MLAGQGRVADARQLTTDAQTELDTYGERWNEPLVLLADGIVAHAEGDAAPAADRLAQAWAVATEQGSHAVARRAAAVAADLGLPLRR